MLEKSYPQGAKLLRSLLTGEIISQYCLNTVEIETASNQMEINMTANTTAAVEVYLAAKAQADQAETVLKAAKADVVAIVGGYGFLEGETADLDVAVQSRSSINEKLLLQFLTQEQIDACKVEGAAYPVIRIKPKKVRKAA